MKLKLFMCLLSCISIKCDLNAQVLWQINKDTIIKWNLEDADEFDAPEINIEKWKYWYGWARSIYGQKEQQYYSEGKNHFLENGSLKLTAKKENIHKRLVDWMDDTTSIVNEGKSYGKNRRQFKYSAGMIQSHKKYKYGYFEIKFKLPKEKGYWPAFWLYGGSPNEEIDWMELKSEKKSGIHVGRHSQKEEENRIRDVIRKKLWGNWVYFKGDLSSNWNVISGEWTSQYVKYFLNGECIAMSKVGLDIEKVLCANIAVPSNDGPFKPGPDTNNVEPVNFLIDYIRVWTKNKESEVMSHKHSIHKFNMENKLTARTSLISKTRFLYGKKSEHTNEGIFVSLIPMLNNKYCLQVLGKNIPENATYTIKGETNTITKQLEYGENIIDLKELEELNAELLIDCFSKKASYPLLKSN